MVRIRALDVAPDIPRRNPPKRRHIACFFGRAFSVAARPGPQRKSRDSGIESVQHVEGIDVLGRDRFSLSVHGCVIAAIFSSGCMGLGLC